MAALEHITIIELAEDVAGEYCGKLLADFGARVVKVERPDGGSPTRQLGPFGQGQPPENSGLFAYLNTNKRSVSLDLTADGGRAALDALLAKADAVIDDHAPGWLAGLALAGGGLDPATVRDARPGLVLCAITPFGREAPRGRANAVDMTVMHASGWGYHTPTHGDPARPPLKGAGRFLPSYEAGLEAAMCVAAALYGRQEDGGGRVIDVSKQGVMTARIDYVLGQMVAGDMDVDNDRHRFDFTGPQGIFPCADGFVYIWTSTPAHWQALRELFGSGAGAIDTAWMDAFPRDWLERGLTPERVALVRGHLIAWLANQGKDAAAAAAQSLGLTLVPVNDPRDLVRSPQFAHRGFFAEVDHPALGRARYPGVPYRMGATPARIDRAAPLLGERAR